MRWTDFVRTSYGYVTEPQTEMLRAKVRSVGVGLTDRVAGPFELCVERIWATNDSSEADEDPGLPRGQGQPGADGELKNKQGQRVRWGGLRD